MLRDWITLSQQLSIQASMSTRVQHKRMLDDKRPKWRVVHPCFATSTNHFCSFVGASTAKNLTLPTLFRIYLLPRHASYNCRQQQPKSLSSRVSILET